MALENDIALAQTFDKSDLAFCIIKVILNDEGSPVDWEFVYLNDALARLEGLKKEELLHHRFFEIFPNASKAWFEYYYPAAYEGKACTFESVSEEINVFLRVNCFPVAYGYCGCILEDIRENYNIKKMIDEKVIEDLALKDRLEVALEETVLSKNALNDALIAARSANIAKTSFLSNMSHDIRTPMNAIMGYTTLAENNIDNRELVLDYLSKIKISGKHLLSLINDVLDMSRIESGKIELDEKEYNLFDLINELRNILQVEMRKKGLTFQIDTDEVINTEIICDKLKFNQIFINIVSNSIKFTEPGGSVSAKISQKNSEKNGYGIYEFSIKDTGIGMSQEFLEHFFEAFERERTSTVSGIQGTGLGMAITKNIVDIMGGSITVDSKPGKGTEVVVTLPLKKQNVKLEKIEGEKSSALSISNKRVLVVEDNEMNCEIVSKLLNQYGVQVECAFDGREAVRKIEEMEEGFYNVILMDIQMPVMDGYEATQIIRSMDNKIKANIPIIAMTANVFESEKKKVYELGMNGHISKPFEIEELVEIIALL